MTALFIPPQLRPNLLGIGAMKSGTTFFAATIAKHPDVFLPPQKELNTLHYEDLAGHLGIYTDYFRGGERAAIRCDFSVRYLTSERAAAAAAQVTPDAKILVILRDPIEQIQSNYWHLRRQNFHQLSVVDPVPDLFEALERFPELLLEPALYGKHLIRWREHFPPDRFFLVDYAEATRNTSAILAKLWSFLGVPEVPIESTVGPTTEGRRGVQPRGGLASRVYPRLYKSITRGPYQALKKTFGVRRVEAMKRRLRLREATEAVFFKPGYPKLDRNGTARLGDITANDLATLETLGFAPARQWRTP